ncbi:DUF4827 family protein [Dysgonomonas sp. BGC7]|uniref:DUF4827 family protein n=1 Tax=Dysgonomonas sp. BGC7 TaxID=1658008 RepID=UPI00068226E2|nr:DUF4827 family protein [Dysgonomonas sp. BGC7]MBD8388738.1 DUF4827 family protein [Dysgonomonas sp. BGC7]
MKKIIYVIFALVGLFVVFSSCKGDSYAKKLEQEKKAIDNFISDNNIDVITQYPADHKFADNQYFKSSTGAYYRVIDPGNDERPISGKTDVYVRYDSVYNMLTNSIYAETNSEGNTAMLFTFGREETYYSVNQYAQEYYLLSNGTVEPFLKGLGNDAEVSIIVPFLSGLGSTYQGQAYVPFFYKRLRYHFLLDQTHE